MIKTTDLCKTYHMGENTVKAVDLVTMYIEKGEFVSITGKSGSGKSTLLHLLSGLDTPTSGSVFYDNAEINKLSDNAMTLFRRKNIGFVFQQYHLIPELNVKENIIFTALLSEKRYDEAYFTEIVENLELTDRLTHLPSQLSGGQQQRVAIARALINRPRVVFCDEPTGNLDSSSSKAVIDFISKMHRLFEQTLVIVTHDHEIAEKADRMLEISDGRL